MPKKPTKEKPEGQTHLDDAAPAEESKPEPDLPPPAERITKENARQVLADRIREHPEFFEPDPPTLEEALKPVEERLQRVVEALVSDRDYNSKFQVETVDKMECLSRAIGEVGSIVKAKIAEQGKPGPALEFSEQTDKLFPALLDFHKKCAGLVEKDAENPFFHSSYASRGAVKRVTHAAMMEAGLFVMNSRQVLGFHEREVYDKDKQKWRKVNCCRMNQVQRITHAASGQYVQTSMLMDSMGTGPQHMGTVDSYGARYNSIALLDLAAEDDDGERGEGRSSTGGRQTAGQRAQGKGGRGQKKTPVSEVVKTARELLMKEIKDRIEEAGILGEVHPSKILKEITGFPRESKADFRGYDDLEQITSKGMVEASLRRLREEHHVLSDEALGRGA